MGSFFALQKKLEDERGKFQKLLNLMVDPVFIIDSESRIVEFSESAEAATGYTREELLGARMLDTQFVSVETKALLQEKIAKHLRGMQVAPYEIEIMRKDSSKRFGEVNALRMIYEGKPAVFILYHDVTERKVLEETLSSLNYYGGKLSSVNSLQQIYDLTLEVVEQILGFEHVAFMRINHSSLQVVCQRGYPLPLSLELPLDGTKKGVTVTVARTRKPMLVPDVTKEKNYVLGVQGIKSELAVPIETEDKILGVLNVESKKEGAFDEKSIALLQLLASHAAAAISNLERREEIQKRSTQLAWLMNSSAEMIRSIDLHQRLQKIVEAISRIGWQRVVLYVTDESLDIRRFDDIVTVGLTREEKVLLWNKRQPGEVWHERFGPQYERFRIGGFYYLPWSDPWVRKAFAADALPSKLSPKEMVNWDPQDLLYAPLRLATGEVVGIISIDDPVDGYRPTEESLMPLELFLHQATVAIENSRIFEQLNHAKNQIKEYADNLELKVEERTKELVEAQSKLLQAERFAAIGQLATMVGHDLRNPLTGIDAAEYYLKKKFASKSDEKAKEMFELIEKDIEYANNIITDLLEYSREIRLITTETSPTELVKEALLLVKVPPNIQVIDSTKPEPKIEVDTEKMKRVFVNITRNAFDAMPESGKLLITSKNSGGNVNFSFTDTGVGMPEEILEKLWTPLFTTKSKGMGLGLPICKRFVEAHGGKITVESKINEGTTFTVTIPTSNSAIPSGGEKS